MRRATLTVEDTALILASSAILTRCASWMMTARAASAILMRVCALRAHVQTDLRGLMRQMLTAEACAHQSNCCYVMWDWAAKAEMTVLQATALQENARKRLSLS